MALNWAVGERDEAARQQAIRRFWDRYFPFMLAVHSDYDYLAIDTETGKVVHGFAPEWEEPLVVAESFANFLDQFRLAAGGAWNGVYAIFLGAGY